MYIVYTLRSSSSRYYSIYTKVELREWINHVVGLDFLPFQFTVCTYYDFAQWYTCTFAKVYLILLLLLPSKDILII